MAVGAGVAWARRPPAERRRLLDAAADVLARRRGDLIGAMIVDGAKTVAEADPEVSEAIDFARYYGRSLEDAGDLSGCQLEPLGPVVVAPPWNFPLSIPASGVLAALAAGNSAILKPAPEAVLVGWHLASALWDAGIPREAVQFLPCPDGDIGRALVTDVRVGAVVLTGSAETARRFLEWRPELSLFAETSGKNAIIVTALADRDQAVRDIVRSAFGHNGQKCSAASLAICEAEVYEDPAFRRQLRDASASLAVGSAWDPASRVTPLTQPPGEALQRALTTLDEGEEWLLEPKRLGGDAPLWSPGIKLGVRRRSFFHQTECFGPVLGLMRARGSRRGHRPRQRHAVRAHQRTPVAGRSRGGALVGADRGGQPLREPTHHWRRRRTAALRRLEGLVGRAGREGRRTELRPPAGPLEPARASRNRRRALTGGAGIPRATVSTSSPETAPRRRPSVASAASYALAWQTHFSPGHDPSEILGEQNIFRYRRCRAVLVRGDARSEAGRLALYQALLAAVTCGVPASASIAPGVDWAALRDAGIDVFDESEDELIERVAQCRVPRAASRRHTGLHRRAPCRAPRRHHRHRRAGGRDGQARASLVPPRADRLANGAPLRQHHRAPPPRPSGERGG